jgi:hypothetical protein
MGWPDRMAAPTRSITTHSRDPAAAAKWWVKAVKRGDAEGQVMALPGLLR